MFFLVLLLTLIGGYAVTSYVSPGLIMQQQDQTKVDPPFSESHIANLKTHINIVSENLVATLNRRGKFELDNPEDHGALRSRIADALRVHETRKTLVYLAEGLETWAGGEDLGPLVEALAHLEMLQTEHATRRLSKLRALMDKFIQNYRIKGEVFRSALAKEQAVRSVESRTAAETALGRVISTQVAAAFAPVIAQSRLCNHALDVNRARCERDVISTSNAGRHPVRACELHLQSYTNGLGMVGPAFERRYEILGQNHALAASGRAAADALDSAREAVLVAESALAGKTERAAQAQEARVDTLSELEAKVDSLTNMESRLVGELSQLRERMDQARRDRSRLDAASREAVRQESERLETKRWNLERKRDFLQSCINECKSLRNVDCEDVWAYDRNHVAVNR